MAILLRHCRCERPLLRVLCCLEGLLLRCMRSFLSSSKGKPWLRHWLGEDRLRCCDGLVP